MLPLPLMHVQKLNRSGVPCTAPVSSVAGSAASPGSAEGFGADARLNLPYGITVSDDGTKLFIAEYGAHRVRVMDTATNDVLLLAGLYNSPGTTDGTGDGARFTNPIAVLQNGNQLYVADEFSHAIRSVDIGTGAVTTVAGILGTAGHLDNTLGLSAQFDRPAAMALSGTTLYVTESGSHVIRSIDTTGTWPVSTVAGVVGTSGYNDGPANTATFNTPVGLAMLGSLLFVADYNNHVIRTLDTSFMEVATLAGSGAPGSVDGFGLTAQLNGPSFMAVEGSTMFVTDSSNHVIRAIDLGTAEVTVYAGQMGTPGVVNGNYGDAQFNVPSGLAISGGKMYVAEQQAHDIRSIEIAPTVPSEPSSTLLSVCTYASMAVPSVPCAGAAALYYGWDKMPPPLLH